MVCETRENITNQAIRIYLSHYSVLFRTTTTTTTGGADSRLERPSDGTQSAVTGEEPS